MKTKLTRISKRTLAMILTVLMMFSMMIVGTVTASAANTSTDAYIYFDNTNTKWTGKIFILLGRSDHSSVFEMQKVTGTNIYFKKGINYNNFTEYCFITPYATDNWGDEGNSPTHRHTYAEHYTKVLTTTSYFSSKGCRLFVPASSTNNCAVNVTDMSTNYYSDMNYIQTTDVQVDNGSGTYTTPATSPATITVSSKRFTGDTTVGTATDTTGTITAGSASSSCTADAARTTSVSYTVSNIQTGYQFEGWYAGTSRLSSATSYSRTITSTNTVYARFKKSTYTVTIERNPTAGGDVTIGGTSNPSTAQIGSTSVSIQATPKTGYQFTNWTTTGNVKVDKDTSATTTVTASGAGTLTANFEKDEPACTSVTLTREPSGTVYKDVEYTFTATAEGAVSGATYHFYVDGSTKQNTVSNEFKTSFADTNTHTVYVQVEKSGYTSVKSDTLSLTPSESQSESSKDVTYYIDLHDNKISTSPTIKFGSGAATTLTKVGESTVYSAKVSTPYKYDAVSGDVDTPIADIPATVTCNGGEYQVTIGKKAISTGEAWLESIGQIKRDKVTTSTTTTSKVSKTKKVVYLVVSTSLSGWTTPHLYCDDGTMEWTSAKAMTKIGTNTSGQSVYAVEVGVSATVGVFKTVAGSADDINNRSVDANLSSSNRFLISTSTSNDNNGNYGRTLTSYSSTEAFVYSHPSTITISSDSSTNISMTKNDDYTGASITYSVPSTYSSIISVSGSTLTAKSVTTRKTATITGTVHSGYYSSMSSWTNKTYDEKTFTINVTVEPEVTSGSFKVMSYKSVSSKFSVENGTFNDNAISTVLTGSEATGNKDATLYNCGIITKDGNDYIVKYAENYAETGYNLLRLTVTVSASPDDGYGFDGWYVGGEKSSQYKNENDAITVDGNDYILKYTEQTKWKVNIIYKYDLYNDSIMTRYDEDNAENDVHKEYEVKDIEFVGSEITDGGYTEILIHNAPNLLNDYYEYHLVSAPQSVEEPDGYVVSTDNAQNTCTITANLKKTVRTYTVYLNGDIRRAGLTYQEPFTIKSGEVSSFNSNQNLIWKDDGKKVATGTSYSFRVTGDMHITAEENKDGVTFNGKSIIAHRSFDVNTAMKQLVHNFYIADFYNDDLGSYVDFVGGGALYFAMDKTTGKPTKATGAVDETGEAIEGKLAEVVERVAGGGKDYYNDQLNVTDNDTNIVCRYLKYDKHKELFKYSDELQAYQYIYSPSFLNDDQYKNYRLRVYSYFIYEDLDEGTYTISVSKDYAEANMYEAGSNMYEAG